jgi:DMSO/TMAO reductase YedYZ molybdopterin-dependent catalytic subunit
MSILADLKTPVFAAEGILHIDPATFRLEVGGLVDQPLSFNLAELKQQFPTVTVNRRLTSVSGWSVRADWNGILWRDFIKVIGVQEKARYVLFASPADYTTVVWLKDLEAGEALLTWGAGGQALEPEYGGPLRMIVPQLWGYKSCKWLCRIEFLEKYRTGYWELRGYSHRAEIEPGETFDVNSGKYQPIPGGEVIDF